MSLNSAKHGSRPDRIYRLTLPKGQDINDWDVLRAPAGEDGLDRDAMQESTEMVKYRKVVNEHFNQAHSMGVSSIPTFVY